MPARARRSSGRCSRCSRRGAPTSCRASSQPTPSASWLLLDDAGERLRELESSPGHVERWANALARYAELQRAAAPDADAFAAAGTIDRRGPLLFDQFDALLDYDYGLEPDELARLRALRPKLEADAERLAELGLPDSIQHDDLHDHNIFVRGDEYRIIDWGDSCVAHPFHSLAVALAVVEHRLGADAVEPVRAAYVDAWSVVCRPPSSWTRRSASATSRER